MSEWLHLEIPECFVGETTSSGNEYITTYRTEILMPQDSEFSGYCFLHPSKLITHAKNFVRLTYNDCFTFTLVKKDREPGKRYKRYMLSASELIAIWAPETERVKAKLAKKEEKRLAQTGAVEILECRTHLKYYWLIVFRYGKKLFYGNGGAFRSLDEVYKSQVVATAVPRRAFEKVYPILEALCDEYSIVQDIRYAANLSVNTYASDKTVAIYDSFYSMSDQWEADFYEKAASIIERTRSKQKPISAKSRNNA